jgi:hypothetical protein
MHTQSGLGNRELANQKLWMVRSVGLRRTSPMVLPYTHPLDPLGGAQL